MKVAATALKLNSNVLLFGWIWDMSRISDLY
jgi:hypothetical protein